MRILVSVFCFALLILPACTAAGSPATESPAGDQPVATLQATPETTLESTATTTQPETQPVDAGESLSEELEQSSPTTEGISPQSLPEGAEAPSPETLAIAATFCCGFTPEFVQLNYLPEVQIWGDGRVLWTEFNSDNQRAVFEGVLPTDQLSDLLQGTVDAGFFGWEELYTSPLAPSDMASQCLFIQVEDRSRRVCEYYEGAPQAFHDLYRKLTEDLNLAGQKYFPSKGYLTAFPIEGAEQAGSEAAPQWEAGSLGVSLKDADGGAWVEGPALQAAWDFVNSNPYGGSIFENGQLYQLSLQLPGVSMVQPPAP